MSRKSWTVNFPGAIIDQLKALAEAERRPLNTQILICIELGLKALQSTTRDDLKTNK